MAGVSTSPILGRIVDKLIPWYATMFSIAMLLLFQSIEVGAGGISVAAVIIAAFGLDVFTQMIQVSVTTAVFGCAICYHRSWPFLLNYMYRISAAARARLNAVTILSVGSPFSVLFVIFTSWTLRSSLVKLWAHQPVHRSSSNSAGAQLLDFPLDYSECNSFSYYREVLIVIGTPGLGTKVAWKRGRRLLKSAFGYGRKRAPGKILL